MALTPLVNLPTPSDPATFDARADNFVTVQLPNLVNEWNTDIALLNTFATSATSTTSNSLTGGNKTFTVEAGKSLFPNMPVLVSNSVNNFIEGRIVSYSGTTLVVSPTYISGTGTFTSWSISMTTLGNYNNDAFKNRIINGAMEINQRYGTSSVTILTTTAYTVDRFTNFVSQSSKISQQTVLDAPVGFKYSTKYTVLASYTPISTDSFQMAQPIEGANVADLNLGQASAKAITVSLWVKGSAAGTYAISITNQAGTRSYVGTIAITTSWVKQTVTLTGDTAGTWLNGAGEVGLYLRFDLGSGSNYNTTAGAWQTGLFTKTTSCINFVSQANGATLNITGVQLEKGAVATDFDRRSFDVERNMCERYFETLSGAFSAYAAAVNTARCGINFKVTKAITPTFYSFGTAGVINHIAGNATVTGYTLNSATPHSAYFDFLASGGGMTAGQGCTIFSATIGFVAEI